MHDSIAIEAYNISRSLKTMSILNGIKKDIVKNGLTDTNRQHLRLVGSTYIAGTGIAMESAFSYLDRDQAAVVKGINRHQQQTIKIALEFIGNFINKFKDQREKDKFKALKLDEKIAEIKTRLEKIPKDKTVTIELPNNEFYYLNYDKYLTDLKAIENILNNTSRIFINGIKESFNTNMDIAGVVALFKMDQDAMVDDPDKINVPYLNLCNKQKIKAIKECLDYFNRMNSALKLKKARNKVTDYKESKIEDTYYENDYETMGFYEIVSSMEERTRKEYMDELLNYSREIDFKVENNGFSLRNDKINPITKKPKIDIKNVSYKELSSLLNSVVEIHKKDNNVLHYDSDRVKDVEIENEKELYPLHYEPWLDAENYNEDYDDYISQITSIYISMALYRYLVYQYINAKLFEDLFNTCDLLHSLTIERHWK